MTSHEPSRVAIFIPDLGLGGAQRLILNMALGLRSKGHQVTIYTPFHDKKYCYEETINGTFQISEHGNWWPRKIFGRFFIVNIMIRMIICALYMLLFDNKFDIVIMDRYSATIPLFRLFGKKVLFYLHFPDKLLCYENQRKGWLKRFYRFVMDYIEEFSLLFANVIVANSEFTKQNYMQSFKILRKFKEPSILYPAIDISTLDDVQDHREFMENIIQPYFLSLNRYDFKKDIDFAIRAYAELKKMKPDLKHKLVIAGGYEPRREDCSYDLCVKVANELGLIIGEDIQLLKNIKENEKSILLKNATCILYTPLFEHFGMVPTEAMYMKVPVIACTTGGPKESIIEGKTGFLLPQDKVLWAEKMMWMIENEESRKEMGENGRAHVKNKFNLDLFTDLTNQYVLRLSENKGEKEL